MSSDGSPENRAIGLYALMEGISVDEPGDVSICAPRDSGRYYPEDRE